MIFIVCQECKQEVATYKSRMVRHKNEDKEKCRE